ncbi:tetratricopeptide repeat protein [Thermomonas carbonis]|uniref:Sel1 repeat family protein n=1 Tax=Thermomonas carbonis TaxID=1463158 RepID=A0A7G9SPL6_9GAMM|nr:SEL1-like repeat protein [Thermomonas carbonis]QNN69791.1 sel1 repeat family protein [Thermomonas carbonis]GHB95523.1 hypothetical protein GCM10010080_03840 [Thermomonas carbonis]
MLEARAGTAFALVLAALFLPAMAYAKDNAIPRAVDGYANGQIFNGKQNMPTVLYGVAQDWNKACVGGDAKACMRLGSAFDAGLGDLDASVRIAVGFYLKACTLGDGPSCASATTIVREGWAEYTDKALALATATRGCEQLGNQAACASLGLLHFRGLAAASSPATARDLWQKSCASGEDDGCRLQAGALFYESADAKTRAGAIPLFEAACSRKQAWGCSGLADAYLSGRGVALDRAKAEEFARKGCLESDGEKIHVCAVHGAALVRSGDAASVNRGEQLLYHGCLDGQAFACEQMASVGFRKLRGATTTLLEAVGMARRGCDLGASGACNLLVDAYIDGIEVRKNYNFVVALTRRACALGDKTACETVPLLDPDPVEYARETRIDPAWPVARQLAAALKQVDGGDRKYGAMRVARLMEEGDEEASWLLGNWFFYGLPGVFDVNKGDGIILIENAARVGHVAAAEFMGMAYWEGNGVAVDQKKARSYMAIASDRGSSSAAAILRSMKQEKTRIANAKAYEEGLRRWEAYFAQQKRMAASGAGSSAINGSGSSSSASMAAASWSRYQRAADNAAFNSRVNNIVHGTACVGSYCR